MEPETAEVVALAREWRALASADLWAGEQHQTINRFLKLWIAVNALYALAAPKARGDRAQLKAFAAWNPVQRAHERHMDDPVYRRSVESLASPGVYNFLSRRTVAITDLGDPCQVLDAVYQVRCNLFHGKKSPTNLRDAQLIQASANVVARILDEILPDESVWRSAAA